MGSSPGRTRASQPASQDVNPTLVTGKKPRPNEPSGKPRRRSPLSITAIIVTGATATHYLSRIHERVYNSREIGGGGSGPAHIPGNISGRQHIEQKAE